MLPLNLEFEDRIPHRRRSNIPTRSRLHAALTEVVVNEYIPTPSILTSTRQSRMSTRGLLDIPIQYIQPCSSYTRNFVRTAPLGTFEAPASSSHAPNNDSTSTLAVNRIQRLRAPRNTNRTRRTAFRFNFMLRHQHRRELNRNRQRRARQLQTTTEQQLSRETERIRQRNALQQLTPEQRETARAIHASCQRASRKRAREQAEINTNQRRASRTRHAMSQRRDNGAIRNACGQHMRQRNTQENIETFKNAKAFREACQQINWGYCTQCKIYFPGIHITNGFCNICTNDLKKNHATHLFSAVNDMDPGEVPMQLTRLSSLEKLLIARIHPMMSVYRVKGQQYKYSGNIINFNQDVNTIATKLPHKPQDLSAILIVRRTGSRGTKDFVVRRQFVREALLWLKQNHRFYNDIIISDEVINDLPQDGIPETLPHIEENVNDEDNRNNQEEEQHQGPPELHEENIHIEEFHTVGTLAAPIQPNQNSCINRALHVADVDRTTIQMPLSDDVIDEFNTEGYITMVFPSLFPYGTADLRQARQRRVYESEYFKYLMQYHDGRFAKDPRFRYFAWNSLSRWRALNLGNIYVKINPQDGRLTMNELRNMVSSGNQQLAKRISYFAQQLRGSRAYWYTRMKELTSMVTQLGAPTIFFTLSAADMQWPDLYRLLDPTNSMRDFSRSEQRRKKAELLNNNPHIVSWYFQERVDLFMKKFLEKEFSVIDYWYRFEWQNRGSGHVHGFLWLEDAPDVTEIERNENQTKIICDYFDRLVSTMNPEPTATQQMTDHPCARTIHIDEDTQRDNLDYISLVNWVQKHTKCGTYCMRKSRITKKMECRFKFPHDISHNSRIVEETPNSKKYRFMGKRNDPLVCSHNRCVLQTWRANIDWSPVLSVQSVIHYIGKYATKAEPASKSFIDTLRGIIEDLRRPCQTSKSAVQRMLMKSVSERDISAQEVCHLLMGYALHKSSRKIVLLNLNEHTLQSATVRNKRQSHDHGSEEVGTDPNFFTRYIHRPVEYENTSLLTMAKKHYWAKNKWCTSKKEAIVRIIPDFDGKILPSSDKWEGFCRLRVLLHQNYRSLEEAKGGYTTWSERFASICNDTPETHNVPDAEEDEFEEEGEAEYEVHENEQEEWMWAAGMGPTFVTGVETELGMRTIDVCHDWSKGIQQYPQIEQEKRFITTLHHIVDSPPSEVLRDNLVVPLHELSIEQQRAHEMIISALREAKPIRMIVCGGAGTGKSTLINAIVRSANALFGNNKTVRVMATTGVAAFNINGSTIHHELALNPDNTQYYKHLEGDQCRRMQDEYRDTKLIIIDEYSMLGKKMLANVDLRCRDIFAKNTPFGNVSIVLVGDIRQLPPVFDTALYAGNGNSLQIFGDVSYSSFDKCVRLSQVFRQSGNEQHAYREALSRISDGKTTIEDWQLFKTRDYTTLTPQEKHSFKYALRLFPQKKTALQYNHDRLLQLGKPVARIMSKNNCETAYNGREEDAKGLQQILCLSEGARVMLRTNLATQFGLVNGAMGTVVDIVYAHDCRAPSHMPVAVMVQFDNYEGPKFREGTTILPITPQTSTWQSTSGVSCQRTQYPLVLCWAITVHKSQGLTLPKAVVDIGKEERLGITFVALSRTRKLVDIAFSPMFSLQRLQRIGRCKGMEERKKEEERLLQLSNTTTL